MNSLLGFVTSTSPSKAPRKHKTPASHASREGDLLDLRARGVADVVDCVNGVEENAVDEDVVASMAIQSPARALKWPMPLRSSLAT